MVLDVTEVAPSTHAKLSASGAARWMACPGQPRLAAQAPDRPSEYASEGTAAHFIAEQCLTQPGLAPNQYIGTHLTVDDDQIEVTEEMAEAVQVYLDALRAYASEGDEVEVECNLTPALQALHPEFGGTSDAVVYKPDQKRLGVWDYKHGAGVMVSPVENVQLKYYALGALLASNKPATDVDVFIAQPRIESEEGPIRSDTFPAVDLLDFAADLVAAAEATEDPEAPLHAGEHCKFCPAAAFCPELEKMHHQLVADEFAEGELTALSPQKLAEALSIIPMVQERIKQIHEIAYQQALRGNPPPGYKLVEKRATRRWKWDDKSAIRNLLRKEGELADDQIYQPRKIKTPAQIEKALPKGRKHLVKDTEGGLIEKKSSGYTLAPEHDKRPPAQLVSPDEFDTVGGSS